MQMAALHYESIKQMGESSFGSETARGVTVEKRNDGDGFEKS